MFTVKKIIESEEFIQISKGREKKKLKNIRVVRIHVYWKSKRHTLIVPKKEGVVNYCGGSELAASKYLFFLDCFQEEKTLRETLTSPLTA